VGKGAHAPCRPNELRTGLPDGVGKEGQETASKLQPLQGREFESEFMKVQIKDHSNDIEKFTQQQNSTQNERIRQFATETIPILQQHLALAQAVEKQLGSQTVGQGSR
jgi:putative membrane protein